MTKCPSLLKVKILKTKADLNDDWLEAICQSAVSAKTCYNSLNFYLSRKPIKKTKHCSRFRNITAEYKLRMDNNSVSFILSSKYINKYLVKLLNLVQHLDSIIITLQHFTRKYNTASI